ncbi:MAG: ATP-binding protein, partial [Nitrososphaerota archaeon]
TAAVVRDSSGGMMLEAGALVLADMGVACIDEIDKMRPEDRVALHEAMAQQTISIAKGGIVATLNARTSILAAANPTLGRYDPYRSFTDNVDLPITILSRFDLIFVLRDEPNRDLDERLTDHVLGLQSRSVAVTSPPIKPEILRKYIAYGRRIRPELTPAAARLIKEFYLQMRSMYQQTSTVTITARQLESLIRLAEARARAALRDYVTEEDVLDVIDLMKRSLSEVGIDIETGRPDIDVILTGKPKSLRDKIAVFLDTLRELQEEKGHAEDEELREALREKGFTDAEISKILGRLLSEGKIFSPRTGIYRIT